MLPLCHKLWMVSVGLYNKSAFIRLIRVPIFFLYVVPAGQELQHFIKKYQRQPGADPSPCKTKRLYQDEPL